jgi:hypothetical protein
MAPVRPRWPATGASIDSSPQHFLPGGRWHRPLAASTRKVVPDSSPTAGRIAHVKRRSAPPRRTGAPGSSRRPRHGRPVGVRRSHGQPMASFRPARADHRASRLGRHPLAESVGLCSFAYVRLVGAFHSSTFFLAPDRRFPSRVGQGPGHGGQGIPSHARRKPGPALVEEREAHRLGTVYRADHSKRIREVRNVGPASPRAMTNHAG